MVEFTAPSALTSIGLAREMLVPFLSQDTAPTLRATLRPLATLSCPCPLGEPVHGLEPGLRLTARRRRRR